MEHGNWGPVVGRRGCAKRGLREEINEEELKEMAKLVKTNFGPDGSYELKSLDTAYNPQYNVIRSREWNRVIGVMTAATKRGAEPDINGYTWEALASDLLAFLKRVQRVLPDAVPDFATKDYQSVCYFTLAITNMRKK